MNADVVVFPPAPPWNQIHHQSTTRLKDSDPSASAWRCFPLLLPDQSPPPENMQASGPDLSLDPLHSECQMDFFHKLGYSTAQVCSIQQRFGPDMDTDKLLGELVKIGSAQERKPAAPVTMMSVVLPRGDAPDVVPMLQVPVPASAPQVGDEGAEDEDALRPIVIDGSNVAMSHGNKEVFSCLGIQLAVNFFLDRGHTNVNVFVPSWRKEQPRPDVPISDQHILLELEKQKILVFTPSRRVAGKRVVCNDDCFIVKLGYESDGIVVSNDMYRDLQGEKPEWKRFIEERLLMYSFVNNKFMPPDDPLGRHGPTLENFLRKFPKIQKKHLCPYGKKCTYGIKCKFHHPERAKQSNRLVADELREKAKNPSLLLKQPSCSTPIPGQSLLLVEDMAKKLSLGHESPSKKDHSKSEPGKTSHRSGKKSSGRKEKSGHRSSPDHGSARPGDSHEQLDSGLGSIDSQLVEAPWSVCDQYQYGVPSFRGCQHVHSVRAQCHPPAPCSCCSHAPPALGSAPHFHHPNQHHGIRSLGGSDILAYAPPHYHGYSAYPLPMRGAYSQPADFQHGRVHHQQQQQQQQQQQRAYWSDPFGAPPPHHLLQGERPQWDAPQAAQPGRGEREVVRKKLLAIFSANLVDTAMDMHPQSMDPQMLVAEILRLQSQNPSMR